MLERSCLPRLGPAPGHRLAVAAGLLLSAWVVVLPASAAPWRLLPGDPGHTDIGATVSYHWLVHTTGLLGAMHSRLLGFPLIFDRTVLNGFPLDVLVSWPLLKLFGWPAGYTFFFVLEFWLLGLSMAWLAGRWWRSPLAALVAGVAIQTSGAFTAEIIEGRTAQTFGAIFLAPSLGLYARALLTGRHRDAALAGLAVGLAMLTY